MFSSLTSTTDGTPTIAPKKRHDSNLDSMHHTPGASNQPSNETKQASNETEIAATTPLDTTRNKHILTLQRTYRGHQVRKKYKMTTLPDDKLMNYDALIVGNDAIVEGLSEYEAKDGRIAIVGTSGLRSVLFACQLAKKTQNTPCPKVFIVDNSKQVYTLWYGIREIMAQKKYARTESESDATRSTACLHELSTFINSEKIAAGCRQDLGAIVKHPLVKYPDQDAIKFITDLFTNYSFDYVRSIIANTSLIKQSWGDKNTFVKIKNILSTHLDITHVIAYPSNIVAYPQATENESKAHIDSVLGNIALLDPKLSIHTNFCDHRTEGGNGCHTPELFYLLENQNPSHVRSRLFSVHCVLDAADRTGIDPHQTFKETTSRFVKGGLGKASCSSAS